MEDTETKIISYAEDAIHDVYQCLLANYQTGEAYVDCFTIVRAMLALKLLLDENEFDDFLPETEEYVLDHLNDYFNPEEKEIIIDNFLT